MLGRMLDVVVVAQAMYISRGCQSKDWVGLQAQYLGARNLVVAKLAKQAMRSVELQYMLVAGLRLRHGGWWAGGRGVVWTCLHGVI